MVLSSSENLTVKSCARSRVSWEIGAGAQMAVMAGWNAFSVIVVSSATMVSLAFIWVSGVLNNLFHSA